MKKRFLMTALMLATTLSVAVVSCKKETPEAMQQACNETQTVFSPENITDMNAYLKGFKKQMQESKGGETMSLEEAAWHLSSLANYDFANANVSYTDVRFDTILGHVNVINGKVSVSDMNVAYVSISSDIAKLEQNLGLDNQHFRFISTDIMDDGTVVMAITTTYTILDHLWYFDNLFYTDTICYYYFSDDSTYVWNSSAANELIRILSIFESHPIGNGSNTSRIYYTQTRENTFYFTENIDPYGSPNFLDSRLLGGYGIVPTNVMCYCLDSYLGLGYDYLASNPNPNYPNETIVSWNIDCESQVFPPYNPTVPYQNLIVKYGKPNSAQNQGDY